MEFCQSFVAFARISLRENTPWRSQWPNRSNYTWKRQPRGTARKAANRPEFAPNLPEFARTGPKSPRTGPNCFSARMLAESQQLKSERWRRKPKANLHAHTRKLRGRTNLIRDRKIARKTPRTSDEVRKNITNRPEFTKKNAFFHFSTGVTGVTEINARVHIFLWLGGVIALRARASNFENYTKIPTFLYSAPEFFIPIIT